MRTEEQRKTKLKGQKRYYQIHKEEKRKYQREYYQKNKEKVKAVVNKWIKNHPERHAEVRRNACLKIYVVIQSLIAQVKIVGCYFCGESDIDILEFAHINKKVRAIAGHYSIKAVIAEMEKCEVMCPTCHRKFDLGKLKL